MEEAEARSKIAATIAPHVVPLLHSLDSEVRHELIAECAAQLATAWEVLPEVAQTPGGLPALLPFNYVIPDQDLQLVESIFAGLTATAGAGYFLQATGFDPNDPRVVAMAITGIAIAMFRFARNFRFLARLEPRDYRIMALLAYARPAGLSSDGIVALLEATDPDLTGEILQERLELLQAHPTLDGTETKLVWKDGAGRWYSNGV